MNNKLQAKKGQNTAEYLIMLVLVAVGSIGVFSVFGDTIKKQVKNVIAAIGGETDEVSELNNASKANDLISKGTGMGLRKDQISLPGESN